MAKYLIRKPAYVNGVHLGAQATNVNPVLIDLPNEVIPSLTWEPADKAGLDGYALAVENYIDKASSGMTKEAADALAKRARAQYAKTIAKEEEPKPVPREVGTNQEMAGQKLGKVVGRASDRSPV